MQLVRRVVYKLGFKPKPGSIFYSPSTSYTRITRELYARGIKQGFDEALVNRVYKEREEDQL